MCEPSSAPSSWRLASYGIACAATMAALLTVVKARLNGMRRWARVANTNHMDASKDDHLVLDAQYVQFAMN